MNLILEWMIEMENFIFFIILFENMHLHILIIQVLLINVLKN